MSVTALNATSFHAHIAGRRRTDSSCRRAQRPSAVHRRHGRSGTAPSAQRHERQSQVPDALSALRESAVLGEQVVVSQVLRQAGVKSGGCGATEVPSIWRKYREFERVWFLMDIDIWFRWMCNLKIKVIGLEVIIQNYSSKYYVVFDFVFSIVLIYDNMLNQHAKPHHR